MSENRMSWARRLAHRIEDLLDRGATPGAIEVALVARGMKPETAAVLVARIVETKAKRVRVQPPSPTQHPGPKQLAGRAQPATSRRFASLVQGPTFMRVLATVLIFAACNGLLFAVQGSRTREREESVVRMQAEIAASRLVIAEMEAQLADRKRQGARIDSMRARIGAGPVRYSSNGAYQADVARYNNSLVAWNTSLPGYRALAADYRALLALHNTKADSLARLLPRARAP